MSNVNKPVIPEEVADAIEALRAGDVPYSNENILLLRSTGGRAECRVKEAEALRAIPFDTMLAALVNGYERELTEEEKYEKKLDDIYDEYVSAMASCDAYEVHYANGIRYALDTLEVKVVGVNA
ncbi:hypothetical protein MKY59_21715 [Paenibacillus sp. FSL W8-0426]|uniref:hypothetical protein n=1 Tax=Paenibacillus sp. FSL W8-0426 TaxID=2921714 RepID=UPI0030D8C369